MSYQGIMNTLGSDPGRGAYTKGEAPRRGGANFEAFLRSLGLDPKTTDPQLIASLYTQWGQANPTTDPPPTFAETNPARGGGYFPWGYR